MTTQVWAVVPAAGRGTRFGGPVPKQYLLAAGEPLLAHTLEALLSHPGVAGVMVAIAENDADWPGWNAFAGKPVLDWQMHPLPLDDLSALRFTSAAQAAPAFHRGHFDLEVLGDSFIDLRGWGRGHVWINDHHLGRYWHIGPQQTLLVPAQWLRHGSNEVIVLELETDTPPRRVQGLANPVFDTPSGAA